MQIGKEMFITREHVAYARKYDDIGGKKSTSKSRQTAIGLNMADPGREDITHFVCGQLSGAITAYLNESRKAISRTFFRGDRVPVRSLEGIGGQLRYLPAPGTSFLGGIIRFDEKVEDAGSFGSDDT